MRHRWGVYMSLEHGFWYHTAYEVRMGNCDARNDLLSAAEAETERSYSMQESSFLPHSEGLRGTKYTKSSSHLASPNGHPHTACPSLGDKPGRCGLRGRHFRYDINVDKLSEHLILVLSLRLWIWDWGLTHFELRGC
jgi:hypothetical protein